MSNEIPAEEYTFLGDITDYWTYTLLRDRLLLMPGLTDPAMRMYLIVRSMVSEDKKNLPGQGLRRMTIDHMCFLLTRDTGKPVSFSLMYQILSLLEDLDLMVPLDTKQDIGASQMKGKEKATKAILRGFLVRDLPPVPYTGWRNAWDKLNHYRPDWRENPPLPPTHVTTAVVDDNGRHLSRVTQVPQDVAFQDSGTAPGEQGQDHDPFQDSGKPFQDSGTPFQEAGTVSPSTSGNAGPKEGSLRTLQNDGPDGRSPGGCRRPSVGSSTREAEGGSAASGKDSPSPSSQEATRTAPSKSRVLTEEQRQARDAILPLLPVDLRQALGEVIPQNVCQAMVDALAAGKERERTPHQLVTYRLMPRWQRYWSPKFYAGELTSEVNGKKRPPFGPLMKMLKDTAECGNDLACEDRYDFVLGADCQQCAMRKTDNAADRERERRAAQEEAERQACRGEAAAAKADPAAAGDGGAPAGPMPTPRTESIVVHSPKPNEWWDCTNCHRVGRGEPPVDGICGVCVKTRQMQEQIAQEQQAVAARYEAPEEEFASASPAPF
ncbi:hypothetical protein ACIRPR_33450 [Streptomyces griseoflavus]|uniref:hypothetical protein n=1 Tax=Streptomyces griseoflavus TaxID=35619 RepID=UPI00382351C1